MEIVNKINKQVEHSHDHDHEHANDHGHAHAEANGIMAHWDILLALFILIVALVLEYAFHITLSKPLSFVVNAVAYLLAGRAILNLAYRKVIRGDFFNEFVLMSVATLGAFYIGEYSEGVAVMVFYQIGEWFQDTAVNRAKLNIKSLLDIRPNEVTVIRNGKAITINPSLVQIGETILVKPGERVALDGILSTATASFNTAALTGESIPDTKIRGMSILAGMVNLHTLAEVQVSTLFKDSKLSRILAMVQDATARKSKTQLFISRFAKVYTPIVFFLALAVVFMPYFFVASYQFNDWLYKGLVFLVISCPCALVVSIPLGYFGGIGLASRNGILFKGGNFLDVMTKVNTIVMDKTGTLTKGVFRVQRVVSIGVEEKELLNLTAAMERNSTHPVGRAVVDYVGEELGQAQATDVKELAGQGLTGIVDGKKVLVGNLKLMQQFQINYPNDITQIQETMIVVAINGIYAGYLTIADEIKEDAAQAVNELHQLHIKTVMLSGDKQAMVDEVAKKLGITMAYGDLLPEDKVNKVQALKDQGLRIAFVGDGVNDAPVLALADVGIAMGGLGSDAAIETADVVIQNDQPSKIVSAIKVGMITRNVVWQNITMAMVVKIAVLILGAGGMANLWEAVIADVGVALLAILNAVRIQRIHLTDHHPKGSST
ncbi:Cd2+/Zn2+-exporting ATPase [Pedobacter sp. CAN_A7]|uniref:heavy metal translocating P-type ATPase n=1 Tax=Pedobacter sp. CAN_A7 TaxID=2787722 RepID=UPI0018CB0226